MSFKWWPVRRTVQLGVIALIASPLFGLNIFRGNLAAGDFLGITLVDPLAFLQATLASRVFVATFLGAAVIVTTIYFSAGGRTFCGWICPIYLMTEIGDKLRSRLGTGVRTFALSGTRWALLMTIVVAIITGFPLFEILSPIGITTRAIMFKAWFPLLLPAVIIVVEISIAQRIWCRSICPVGGYYALLGRYSPVRIGFNKERCTGCGECSNCCPVEEVLEPVLSGSLRQVVSGDCTRCADCIDICPTRALKIDVWYK